MRPRAKSQDHERQTGRPALCEREDMIEVSGFNSCWTIVFLNNSHVKPTPTVWVCVDKNAFDLALTKLAGMKWIQVVQSGASHVEGIN